MAERSTCDGCKHFQPGPINPGAGMGFCTTKRVWNYPHAPHYCRERQPIEEGETRAQARVRS